MLALAVLLIAQTPELVSPLVKPQADAAYYNRLLFYKGQRTEADLRRSHWPAFGFIAAEVELKRNP